MRVIVVGVLLLLLLFLMVLPVEGQTVTPTAAPTACPMPPSRKDITNALAVAGDIFDPLLWTVDATNQADTSTTNITWVSNRLGAVAFLQMFHYDCGVTEVVRQQNASPDFDVVFTNYTERVQTAQCASANGTALFEFNAVSQFGDHEHALYWIKQVSPTRIVVFNLVMPAVERSKQANLARRLFPELPSCDGLHSAGTEG